MLSKRRRQRRKQPIDDCGVARRRSERIVNLAVHLLSSARFGKHPTQRHLPQGVTPRTEHRFGRLMVDGRNALDPEVIREAGLDYEGIGRQGHVSLPV